MGIMISVLLLAACGTEHQEESAVLYTAEYTAIPAIETGGYMHCLTTDGLWYVMEADGFVICHSNAEGVLDREIALSVGEIPKAITASGEESELVCLIYTDEGTAEDSCLLRFYDWEGGRLREYHLEQMGGQPIRHLLMTVSGQIYAASEQQLFVIAADGSSCSSYAIHGERLAGIAMDEAENLYAVQSHNGSYEILQLDQQTDELEEISAVRTGYSPILSHGCGLYFTNGSKLFQYADGWQDILSFAEQAINGGHVQEILCTAENRYQILAYDAAQGEDWEIACLTRQEEELTAETETVEKIPLAIATVVKEGGAYMEAIVNFNRSYPNYHLQLKDYIDENTARQQQIQTSLLGSDAPDILEVYSMSDYENYVDKGYLEPLIPYLAESEKVDLEDFLPEIVEAYTRNGQIYAIPTTFTVKTLACSQSLLGERTGWTIEEFLDFLEEHPGTYLSELHSNLTREELTAKRLLGIVLDRGLEGFIDWETGEVQLDSERFRNIMERIRNITMAQKNSAEEVILWEVGIYQAAAVRDLEYENHEAVVLIGYPTAEEGESNAMLSPGQPLAITGSSEEKEGAWLFIEGQLASERTYRGFDLPTRVSQLEKKLELEWETYRELPDWYNLSEEAAASYVITERQMNMAKETIEKAVFRSDTWLQIRWIIQEEAEYYFSGTKSLDEVIDIMQNRVQLYLNERQ